MSNISLMEDIIERKPLKETLEKTNDIEVKEVEETIEDIVDTKEDSTKETSIEEDSKEIKTESKKLEEQVDWSYFNKFDKYTDKYLPPRGDGDNQATQMVTALCKLVYKWYNDGDVYDNTYMLDGWANDISGSANWLYKYVPGTDEILNKIKDAQDDSDYENILKELCDFCYKDSLLEELEEKDKVGNAYSEDGPFEFDDTPEEEDDWYDEDEDEWY